MSCVIPLSLDRPLRTNDHRLVTMAKKEAGSRHVFGDRGLMGLRLGDGNQWNDAETREHASDQREENGAMRGGSQGHLRPD